MQELFSICEAVQASNGVLQIVSSEDHNTLYLLDDNLCSSLCPHSAEVSSCVYPQGGAYKHSVEKGAAGRDDDNDGEEEQQIEGEAAEASDSPQDPAEGSTEDPDAEQEPRVRFLEQVHDPRYNPDGSHDADSICFQEDC